MKGDSAIGLDLVCPMSCVRCETDFEFTVEEALRMYAGQGMARCPGCGAGYSVSHPFLLAFVDEEALEGWKSDASTAVRVHRIGLRVDGGDLEPGHRLHEGQPRLRPLLRRALRRALPRRRGPPYEQGFDLRLWPERLEIPLRWRRPRLVFVNSMSDLFHEEVPLDFIEAVFDVMARADWHAFQVLTKRHERLTELAPELEWPPNVWIGVSIENKRWVRRADSLRQVRQAAVRFISAEPLLGPLVGLDLSGIDWLIAGGESGPRHRPVKEEWLTDLRDRCLEAGVPFFFKQWGGARPKSGGREFQGETSASAATETATGSSSSRSGCGPASPRARGR